MGEQDLTVSMKQLKWTITMGHKMMFAGVFEDGFNIT